MDEIPGAIFGFDRLFGKFLAMGKFSHGLSLALNPKTRYHPPCLSRD
jgi:hypothetical protein